MNFRKLAKCAAALAAAVFVGGLFYAAPASADDDLPLQIDMAAGGVVTDGNGQPLTDVSTEGDAGETITYSLTPDNRPVVILRQSALPIQSVPVEPEPVDPEIIEEANKIEGTVPIELVPGAVEGDVS
ncbi:hypothetical protein [Okibacterium endophyticum]